MIKSLREELKLDEGLRLSMYKCTEGFNTIGYGHNCDSCPTFEGSHIPDTISQNTAERLLDADIAKAQISLYKAIPWIVNIPKNQQEALINMTFQMGINGLLKFKNTLKMIKEGRINEACDNARKSLWYKQTPNRAERVIMRLKG